MEISADNKIVFLTLAELSQLPNYSWSVPTGQTLGKRWRCNNNDRPFRSLEQVNELPEDWYMGEYYMDDTIPEGQIGIRWRKMVITDLPKIVQEKGGLPIHLL